MGLGEIFKSSSKIIDGANNLIDNVSTSDEEKLKLKNDLSKIVLDNLNELNQIQGNIIESEAKGNVLQRSWRPILMLSFGFVVVYSYFIQPAFFSSFNSMKSSLPNEFWSLLEIGIGGYVIGRSTEKVAESLTKNVDLSMIKKRKRSL